jgi:hypothetical protein
MFIFGMLFAVFLTVDFMAGWPVVLPFLFKDTIERTVAYQECMERFYEREQQAIQNAIERGNYSRDALEVHPTRLKQAEERCAERAAREQEGKAQR